MTGTGKPKGVALGAGYFSPFQYETWTRIPEVDIVAMYNRTEERAAPIQARFGVPRLYTDRRHMIDREQPDFIDIITPPETHEEICRYAAGRGVHIICRKPLAPSYEECDRAEVNFAGDCVYALQRHFVDCVLSGGEFESNGADYLNTVRVVEAAYESAVRGETVRVSS
jgi:predicted dehydrogenase